MSPLVVFLLFLSLVSCQIVLPGPDEQLIVEQPSGHVTTVPIDVPSHLSRGERMTMSTPGFRIGDVNEPIEIIPPAIGNWIDPTEVGQAVQTTIIAPTTNITNTTETTTTTANSEQVVIANNPWSAMTGINITITTPSNTTHNTSTTSTPSPSPSPSPSPTPSPTWITIQSDRESSYHAPRPAGFPQAPPSMSNMSISETSFNMTIHGNLTSFNLTAHNMTSNHTRVGGMDGWAFIPGSGESYITGNITGAPLNITVIAPNTTVSIIGHTNGTTTVLTNITNPTPTPTKPPQQTPHEPNATIPSSALLDASYSLLSLLAILLSCVFVY